MDVKLLTATAAQLGIFIENALLYEDLNATFLGTLEALTNSIDAKDKYTCGHSQRVALLTAQLAQEAGLDEDQVDRYRIAGLVHDIGKIGVPESVLLKTGGLTTAEYESIQKHPEIGARILKNIPQMEDILGGVLHHHEKYDGSGYPHGIAGEDIPLVARMISLADTFDAMSSSRTYRNAMTRNSVLDEMNRVAGKQFDPELIQLFMNLDFSEWEQLMIEHQAGSAAVPRTTKESSMKIISEAHLAATVITITGEFMSDDADKFQRTVQELSGDFSSNFILDCSELTLIDSVGLESLIWLSSELSRNGNKLKFAAVSSTVQRVFELTRLERVFCTHDTVEAAARSFT